MRMNKFETHDIGDLELILIIPWVEFTVFRLFSELEAESFPLFYYYLIIYFLLSPIIFKILALLAFTMLTLDSCIGSDSSSV